MGPAHRTGRSELAAHGAVNIRRVAGGKSTLPRESNGRQNRGSYDKSSWVPSSMVEQRPFKPWVLGSSPREPTNEVEVYKYSF